MSSILRILNLTEMMLSHQVCREGEVGRKVRMLREGSLLLVQKAASDIGLWPEAASDPPSMFRHWRNGKAYVRLSQVLDTHTEKPMELYIPLYPCEHAGFIRSPEEFSGEARISPDGPWVPRFTRVRL